LNKIATKSFGFTVMYTRTVELTLNLSAVKMLLGKMQN